jgi:hypothetical protein
VSNKEKLKNELNKTINQIVSEAILSESKLNNLHYETFKIYGGIFKFKKKDLFEIKPIDIIKDYLSKTGPEEFIREDMNKMMKIQIRYLVGSFEDYLNSKKITSKKLDKFV